MRDEGELVRVRVRVFSGVKERGVCYIMVC